MLQFNKLLIPAVIAFLGLTACGTQEMLTNEIIRLDPVPEIEEVEPDIEKEEETEIQAPVEPVEEIENDDTTYDTTNDTPDEIPAASENENENVSAYDVNTSTETDSDENVSAPDISYETETETETKTETEIVQYISGGFPIWDYPYLSGEYLGRLRVPAVGVDVACYYTSDQSSCDAEDRANFVMMGIPPDIFNWTAMIGDHAYQGFDAIKNITTGTKMFFDCKDGNTYAYVCDIVDPHGYNDGYTLYDSSGNTIYIGGIWLYTCNEIWQYVTLVHFVAI